MDSVIRLVSSVSAGPGAICWAAGLQQKLPKFHSLLLIRLLIKKKLYWPPRRDRDMHMDITTEQEKRQKDQGAVSKLNVMSELTRLEKKFYKILSISHQKTAIDMISCPSH